MPSVTNNSATITPVTVAQSYRFVVGVDTHAATHSYAILDAAGALLDEQTFPTTLAGIGRAREWIARRSDGDLDGVLVAAEGTGSYGAVLAKALAEIGYRVVEAPAPRRERGRGKTDAMDAVTAARNTLTMPIARLRDRRGGQDQVALQVLTTAREQLNAERLRAINALTALVRSHELGIDARRALASTQIRQIAGWRRRAEPVGIATARAEAVRLAGRVVELDADLKSNRDQLTAIVTDRAPELLAMPGVGAITAAVVLCVWSHPGRVRSEAAMAQIAGTCPIPASSGNTVRHRLNRGGDRRLNWALNTVVLTRMRTDPATRDYVARAPPKARPAERSDAASSATPPARSTAPSTPPTHCRSSFRPLDRHRSIPGLVEAPSDPVRFRPLMDEAKAEVLAFTAFPRAHWRKISSTNPLERVTKEIKRRSRVVDIFPNAAAVIRLVGAVLIDMHDEWIAGDRRYLSEESMASLNDTVNTDDHAAIKSGE